MSRLGVSLCWSLLAAGSLQSVRDTGVKVEMLKPPAVDFFEFISKHYRNYGVFPDRETVLDEVNLDEDFVFDAPEPPAFYAEKVVNRDALNAQRNASKQLGESLRSRDAEQVHEAAKAIVQVGMNKLQTGVGCVVNLKDNGPERWETYLRLKNAEDGIRGLRTPWEPIDAETGGLKPGDLVVLAARLGLGKCVAAGTKLVDTKDGRQKPVGVFIKERLDVLTFDKAEPVVRPVRPSAWIATGTKECLRLTTRLGHSIEVTPEHPMLTSAGWVRADELRISDSVVAAASIPEPLCPVAQPQAEMDLLAVLLADGSLTGSSILFSKGDPDYVEFVRDTAAALGVEVRQRSKYDYALVPKQKVQAVLDKHGVPSAKSIHKEFPSSVFSLPNEQLRRFLTVFWWGDGGKDAQIGLSSEKMLDDVQHLLLRFGVVARKRYKLAKCDGKEFDSWVSRVESWTIQRFKELMSGMLGEKGRTIQSIPNSNNPNTDNIPVTDEMVSAIKRAAAVYSRGGKKGLYADAGRVLGRTPRQTGLRDFTYKNNKRSVGRKAFRVLVDVADGLLDDIAWMASDEIVFVELTSIEQVGEREVYDLTIPQTHAFIAENLVVHNTFAAVIISTFVGKNGSKVGFVSPEMSREAIELRRDAVHYLLPYRDFLRGELDFETENFYQEQLLSEPTDEDNDWFIAAEGRVKSVVDAELFVQETGVDLLVIDGIYLLDAGDSRAPWHERVMMVTRGLKELALKCQIPIVATAQFNRSVRTGSLRAGSEAIGHTDAIGQYADVLIGMFQDDNMRAADQMLMRVLKNREGRPVELTINWNLVTMNFAPLTTLIGGEGGGDDDQNEEVTNVLF